MKLYHGTSAKNVPSIEARGLIAGHGQGADDYARAHHWGVAALSARDRPPSVYCTSEYGNAVYFARMIANSQNSKPVILHLDIPRDVFEREFVDDEEYEQARDGSVNAWRTQHAIPPKYIAKVEPVPASVKIDGVDDNPIEALLEMLHITDAKHA